MDEQDIIREFLKESEEGLARLDQDMVALERNPGDASLIASVFRSIHTIKGTCGFFGFNRLEKLTHITEDILAQLRNGTRTLDGELTTLILQSVDAVRRLLGSIATGGDEGAVFELDLIARLEIARDTARESSAPQPRPPGLPARPNPVRVDTADPVNDRACQGILTGCPDPPSKEPKAPPAESTLRVDVALLDRLMNLVGELVLTRNQLVLHNAGRDDAALSAVSQRLNLLTSELQESVMKTRMQPIGVVWNKLPRIVRDLANSLHKQIDLEMEGADTELDRTLIEAIKDPLTHIVRNSCDHGIELPAERRDRGKTALGRLKLHAWHEGGQVNIEIVDDGAGIDPARVKAKALERKLLTEEQAARLSDREAVNLVFLPGFSTAAAVTNISGRGVGMDVVRTHIERIGGTVDLSSRPGEGTTVRVRIPLTLAIIPGLVVSAGGQRFVIPQINLNELIQTGSGHRIEFAHTAPVLRCRNELLPLTDLCTVLGLPPERVPGEATIVVIEVDQRRFGVIVDAICDSQEIVVKPLGHQLKPLNCYAGAAIMGDGRIALILDVAGLAQRAGMTESSRQARRATAAATRVADPDSVRRLLLLFRAGNFERLAVPLSRVARLEKIEASMVERASGRDMLQYRGRILPLLDLGLMLGTGSCAAESLLRVIVVHSGADEIGMVVDEISDIVDEAVIDPRGALCPGLLGSALIGGRVTDLVDLDAIAASVSWSAPESLANLAAALAPAEQVLR